MSKRVFAVVLVLAVATMALAASGCGSSGDDDKKSDKKVKLTKDEQNKADAVKKAEGEFKKQGDDFNACRNLAFAYQAAASPTSTGKKNEVPKMPADRTKNLKLAASTLEKCISMNKKDPNTKQMLASTYSALSEYDKSAPLLEAVAKERKTDANAYYAWGVAASNSQNTEDAIAAWKEFLEYAPKNDPRIKQVKAALDSLNTAGKKQK